MTAKDSRESRLPEVQAAFADAAQAERAVAQLQQHGVDADRIDVEHGGTASPGRTAAEDREVADRMSGSWLKGAGIGALVGGLLGAVIGGTAFGWATNMFWGVTIGLGVALTAIGGLYGLFSGFTDRGGSTRGDDAAHRPELSDAVRVIVHTKPGEHDAVLRILRDKGGAA